MTGAVKGGAVVLLSRSGLALLDLDGRCVG